MSDQHSIHRYKTGDVFHSRYRLEKLIGVGGFADVWSATDTVTNTLVALKIYTNLDADDIKDLSQEYRSMQGLSHTNILRADHFDRWGTIPYLVMKYCSGGSLDKQIGKLTLAEISKVMLDMARGLAYLHSKEIVHQDIKPANVLIDNESTGITYILSDFGISSKTKTRLSHSVNVKNDSLSLTEAYAPPEKFSPIPKDRIPDRKGDIFSFGISIYELITGYLPFDNLSTGRQLQYENVSVYFDDIHDPNFRRIIELCMKRNRNERPPAQDIVAFLEGTKPIPFDTAQANGDADTVVYEGIDDQPAQVVMAAAPLDNRTTRPLREETLRIPTPSPFVGAQPQGYPQPPAEYYLDEDDDEEDNTLKYLLYILLGFIVIAAGVYFAINMAFNDDDAQQETFTVNGVVFDMVKINGATFAMGCDTSDDPDAVDTESPVHSQTLKDFYIGKYEVTQGLWEAVMGSNPSTVVGAYYPVNNVSWQDCQLFLQKLNQLTGRNFRLPTEAEWEFAAKARASETESSGYTYDKYPGTNDDPWSYAWYIDNSGSSARNKGKLHTIGQVTPNGSGLYDMAGNVAEWCEDIYVNYYSGDPEINSNHRVLRGGYYGSPKTGIRCTSRSSSNAFEAKPYMGLRLAL